MNKIEMVEVDRKIQENPKQKFVFKYVRATGKHKGSIKEVQLGLPPNSISKNKTKAEQRKYLHKDKWTMNLYNYKKNRPETPLYSHIIEFEGQLVKH